MTGKSASSVLEPKPTRLLGEARRWGLQRGRWRARFCKSGKSSLAILRSIEIFPLNFNYPEHRGRERKTLREKPHGSGACCWVGFMRDFQSDFGKMTSACT